MAFSMVTIRSMTIDCTVGCAVEGIRDSNEAQSLRRGVRDLYSYSNDIIINLVRPLLRYNCINRVPINPKYDA